MGNNRGFELSRRGLLGAAGGLSAGAVLTACGGGGGAGGGGGGGGTTEPISFWNMPWGSDAFNPTDEEIVTGYTPAEGMPSATYQAVQWANFTQTFSSAVASQTGPAVSSGGGTQAFLFENQGAIAYADNLLETWKGNGLYEDFLPGLIDTMKTERGYAAVPYNLDMRVLWVNPTLLEEAGTEAPTDWQSFLDACEALKAIDVYGYGDGSGSGRFTGGHILVSWMIGNGGGLFNAEQQPDCVTPANIEAMEFVLECVSKGYVDPASATYTSDNVQEQWRARRFGMGFDGAGLATNIGGEVGGEIEVNSPLMSPAGTQGMLYFPNNIMMYTDTPSQEGSEAFLTYYYQNMSRLWTEGTGIGLPPLTSITETPEFQEDVNNVKIIDEYVPVAKTWAAPGGAALFQGVTSVDATPIIDTFTQSILTGATDARSALEALQAGIQDAITG